MKLIVVTPHGRSGSYLVHSLLDGHPNVVCFPAPIKYFFPELISDPSFETEKFIANNIGCFEFKGRSSSDNSLLGKNKDEEQLLDKTIFQHVVQTEINRLRLGSNPIKRRDYVICLHLAVAKITAVCRKKIKYILLHLHNYDGGHELALADFPELLLVACLRDPREDILSWLRYYEKADGQKFCSMRDHRRDSYLLASAICFSNFVQFSMVLSSKQIILIDLNYLHSNGERGIKKLADRLEIDFHNSMLNTTFLGKIWWGNSASGELSNGLSVTKAKLNWPDLLPEKDQTLISTTLKIPISLFGYATGNIDERIKLKDPRKSLIGLNLQIESIRKAFWDAKSISKKTILLLTIIRIFIVWIGRNVFFQNPLGRADFSNQERFRKLVGNLKKGHFLH